MTISQNLKCLQHYGKYVIKNNSAYEKPQYYLVYGWTIGRTTALSDSSLALPLLVPYENILFVLMVFTLTVALGKQKNNKLLFIQIAYAYNLSQV